MFWPVVVFDSEGAVSRWIPILRLLAACEPCDRYAQKADFAKFGIGWRLCGTIRSFVFRTSLAQHDLALAACLSPHCGSLRQCGHSTRFHGVSSKAPFHYTVSELSRRGQTRPLVCAAFVDSAFTRIHDVSSPALLRACLRLLLPDWQLRLLGLNAV